MLKTVAVGLLVTLATSGCALREREWGSCAVAGAVVGAVIGGTTGGVASNNASDNPDDGLRAGAIAGGVVGGAALGALLGHAICDPMKEPQVAQIPPAPPPPAPGTKLAEIKAAHFDFNRAELKPAGRAACDEAVRALKANASTSASVEGHTDSVGSDAYNQRLSERRAQTVADYLTAQGIASSRLRVVGYGESKPAASNDTAEGRARNRRVEIIAR